MSISGSRNYGAAGSTGLRSVEQFKQAFFDREAIITAMDKSARKALSKFGAFVRRRAQTSLRYRQKPSAAGSPPSAHRTMSRNKTNKKTGVTKTQEVSPLREFIFFAYMADQQAVIIGPAKTNQIFFQGNRQPVKGTVPRVLEEGGAITILEWFRAGRWQRADLRSRRRFEGRPTRMRTVEIRARPYMNPAFQAELPQLIQFFHNSF